MAGRRLDQAVRITMLLRNTFTRDARVLREARSLAAAGHEVTVLAIRLGDLPREEVLDGFRVLRAVEAKPWMGPTILGTASSAAGGSSSRRRPSWAVILRDNAVMGAFHSALRGIRADVIHAHDLNVLPPAVKHAKRHGERVVYDAHELYPDLTGLTETERRRWRRTEARLITGADAVIAPTAARADLLATRYGIPTPTVIMNCPDPPTPGLDDTRLERLRRPGELLAVYAGGFTPNRGLANLIRAAGSLEGVRLAMLGWGPLEAELRAVAAPFGDRVEFVGPVDPDLVVATCSHADAGIVSYEPIGLNNQLAAPNKLFEYLHAGIAVAGSDLPDVRAILTQHDVGATFDAASTESIRGALMALRDGDLEGMRARARAAAPSYTWAAQAESLLDLYARLATTRG